MKSFKVNPGDNFLRTDIENLISGKVNPELGKSRHQ